MPEITKDRITHEELISHVPAPLHFVPCGDRSLLVYVGQEMNAAVNQHVHTLSRSLQAKNHPAVVEVTPGYHSLLVEYDPVRIRLEHLEEIILSAVHDHDASRSPRNVNIPVHYGGETGPDLSAVAAHTGLTADEVVHRHSAGNYRVYCLGFSPGFPYLGGLEPSLHTPRLASPRTRVPGGSVGIANGQTGVYPGPSPGGWQIIGRTPSTLFDARREPPTLVEPGDMVRFSPITAQEYERLAAESVVAPQTQPTFGETTTGLRILRPGLATTIQDLGRRGFMRYGVPVAGAADFRSLMIGNWLLSNRARTSALEITLNGPEVEFTGPVAFCITGAPVPAELIPASGASPRPVRGWTALLASPGDRLRLGTATAGCRSYLCVAGGIDLPPVLGSLSEDLFGRVGPLGRPLKTGDWLPVGLPLHPPADLVGRYLPADAVPDFSAPATIQVMRGPQANAFSADAMDRFLQGEYLVGAQSDRQGLRLEGPAVAPSKADIISEPLAPGSIQVPSNGLPILLLSNRQTMGGYAKIAVAVYPDLAVAAQLRPGDHFRFREVDLTEAHAITWAERRRLVQVRRHLERTSDRLAEPAESAEQRPVVIATSQAANTASAPTHEEPAIRSVPEVRTFRITIGDVEYTAEVAEYPDRREED